MSLISISVVFSLLLYPTNGLWLRRWREFDVILGRKVKIDQQLWVDRSLSTEVESHNNSCAVYSQAKYQNYHREDPQATNCNDRVPEEKLSIRKEG